jgi:hypothetical protein
MYAQSWNLNCRPLGEEDVWDIARKFDLHFDSLMKELVEGREEWMGGE